MKKLLTDKTLKALKPAPAGKQIMLWDAVLPNFGVRLSDRANAPGRAAGIAFIVMRRTPGRATPVRVTLGRYPGMSLTDARKRASTVLEQLSSGIHPAEAKRARAKAEAELAANTVAALAADFIADMNRRGLRTAREFEQIIRREIVPVWGNRPVSDITAADAAKLISAILHRGSGGEPAKRRKTGGAWSAHHALALGKTLFNWGVDQHRYPLTSSPFERLRPKRLIGEKQPRQRILDAVELRLIWQAAEVASEPYGDLVRLLLLTGQRLNQVATLRRSDIDLAEAIWVTPAASMKMNKPHATPLAPTAIALLAARMDQPHHRNGFVFSTTGGEKPFSGFSKAKTRLDATITALRGVDGPRPPWTLHDLRRTVRSTLPALGVPDTVCEAVLAHARPGISSVYDHYSYLAEKRAALNKWAERVASIVNPPPDNLLPLRSAR